MKPKPQSKQPLSVRQRWVFRGMALALPLLLLAAIEVFLRLAGIGYPTEFFLRERIEGREMLVENPQFGWRFFPEKIARTPNPTVLARAKPPGTTRIFFFGESAAMGDPEPAFGAPRQLQAMLEAKFPGQRFEVVNVAMTAINSHVIREIARDCAPLAGDLWIVYAGNNEVVGPFGAGTVFGREVPGRAFIRATLWLKQFRLGQWLASLGARGPEEWGGMEMFLDKQVAHEDPRLRVVHEHFRRNLEDIVSTGEKAGANVILSTVAVNLKDCPPFASQRVAVPGEQLAAWTNAFARGVTLTGESNFSAATESLLAAQRIAGGTNDAYAETHFHLGRCELETGDALAARERFNAAKEFDTLRFRADDAINNAIRDVARVRGLTLVDAAALLNAQSPFGIAGSESFYEHVHFNFEGNHRLAAALFDAVVPLLPATISAGTVVVAPTAEEVARRLAWTDWDELKVLEEMRRRLAQPPFTGQFGHAARDRVCEQRIAELAAGLTPENFARTVAAYEEALRLAPDDRVLHENFAHMLEANGETVRAIAEWQTVLRLAPHSAEAAHHVGNLLDRSGRSEEALVYFRAALRRDPRMNEARNGLALALSAVGRHAEAQREWETILRGNPKFTLARVNLGQMLARQGDWDAARAHYEQALRDDTNNAAAHVNLGKLLNERGDKAGAVRQYEAALRINPSNAVAHFNLGNAQADGARALEHYRAAVAANPSFAEARAALAVALARSGQLEAAEKEFQQALRLQPNHADARFNYGALLANAGRFPEAAAQFAETLRLNPAHPKAGEFLARVQGRAGTGETPPANSR